MKISIIGTGYVGLVTGSSIPNPFKRPLAKIVFPHPSFPKSAIVLIVLFFKISSANCSAKLNVSSGEFVVIELFVNILS